MLIKYTILKLIILHVTVESIDIHRIINNNLIFSNYILPEIYLCINNY